MEVLFFRDLFSSESCKMEFVKPYVYFIALSFLVSLIVYFNPRSKEYYLRFFPPFLLATLIVETYGLYLGSIGRNNIAFYNFFTAFEFCFYLIIIKALIVNNRVKRVILITILGYALIAVVNILFIQKIRTFHTITYALGCLLVTIFCFYYFFELFKKPKSFSLIHQPAFWICSGLLFFYCCGFPLFALINHWGEISKVIQSNFISILWILNIFQYSLFAIAFLCSKTRKYILSQS